MKVLNVSIKRLKIHVENYFQRDYCLEKYQKVFRKNDEVNTQLKSYVDEVFAFRN